MSITTSQSKLEKLMAMREEAQKGGGEDRIAKHHAKGKFTARERIEILVDPDSFEEFDLFKTHRCTNFGMEKTAIPGDGVVTGYGTVNGRLIYVYSQDFTVFGGSLSETVAEKIKKLQDMAMKNGAPLIGLNDSGGARIQEGIESLGGYSDIFLRNVMASGVIPQITGIFGPCAGGAVYSPALNDFVVMVDKKSYMFLTGPKVVKTVTHETVDAETLGGAHVHTSKSGVAHFASQNEKDALLLIRELISFIPQNNREKVPHKETLDPYSREDDSLNTLIPDNPKHAYNIKDAVVKTVDEGHFFEVQPNFAKNIVIGFGRYGGQSVGIIANQPEYLAGVLDCDASNKAARFIRFCDAFNIPLVTFVDVPGFLPGTQQEYAGVIRNGAKLIYAYAEATVPKIAIITRKAYGGAYCVMSPKHLRGDINYAWPTAEIAVMGAKGASEILYAKDVKQAPERAKEILAEKEDEYTENFSNPYWAARRGYIDDVIEPKTTRLKIIKALKMLENKVDTNPKKKHGSIPL